MQSRIACAVILLLAGHLAVSLGCAVAPDACADVFTDSDVFVGDYGGTCTQSPHPDTILQLGETKMTFSNNVCDKTITKVSPCDLARSCGARIDELCTVAQSTYYNFKNKEGLGIDGDASTCAKTANAIQDDQAQWFMVNLGKQRLVGTVRFVSEGEAGDFEVLIADDEPGDGTAPDGVTVEDNPAKGGRLPSDTEPCDVEKISDTVFEAYCPGATKGKVVIVKRSAVNEVLSLCDIQVFAHECEAGTGPVSCEMGYEPSSCPDCRGCVPCSPGWYSDKVGDYACTPCPAVSSDGAPAMQAYSPKGSTSEFQCLGDAVLDSTSTLEVENVEFDQTEDAWKIDIEVSLGPKIQVNGLSALYLSNGGAKDSNDYDDKIYLPANFPCRADTTSPSGADLSASLAETVCCLQDMRDKYFMTKIFRDYTDDLDLVAANDVCDAEDGSNLLVNADLSVWGEGTEFVDPAGKSLASPITIKPKTPANRRDGEVYDDYYEGKIKATITIPDAELFKVSRSRLPAANPPGEPALTDQREIFIGLLDMLPTGTRVVDSANQQVSVVLTRTQYGTFSAHGEQNIDYDFISYLNARVHAVFAEEDPTRRALVPTDYYVEITYVYDDRLQPKTAETPVIATSVDVTVGENTDLGVCDNLDSSWAGRVNACPTNNMWEEAKCPQVSIADDHFGRLYVPLLNFDASNPPSGTVKIEFLLELTDGDKDAQLEVAMDVVVDDYVSWCDAAAGSIDLAERVIPSITIGTESENPPRLTGFDEAAPNFDTGAETLQDGLITLELSLNETNDLDENLEVFMEDVLVIHINPGSDPAFDAITNSEYVPTYTYDPDTRDATLHIPDDLKAACSNKTHSESFFGCTYKHVLAEEEITNAEWSYKVGSGGAQDFMETMLGTGTASVAARELGREYEESIIADGFGTVKKVALWINPGHVWGQEVHNSEYSLSQHVVVYVLFGVRSGVDGSTRRMLLQATSGGAKTVRAALEYKVSAKTLVEKVLGDVTAVEVQAEMPLAAADACKPEAELLALMGEQLKTAVKDHASAISAVHVMGVEVKGADCSGNRRADATAVVDAVIALEESEEAFLDLSAVEKSGAVLSLKQTDGGVFPSNPEEAKEIKDDKEEDKKADKKDTPAEAKEESSSSSNTAVIGAAVGAAAGVVILALVGWKASKSCGGSSEPLTEVVSTSAVMQSHDEKIETLLFNPAPGQSRQ